MTADRACSSFTPRSEHDATNCACGWSAAAHREHESDLKDWRVRYALAATSAGREVARRALIERGETAEVLARLDALAAPVR